MCLCGGGGGTGVFSSRVAGSGGKFGVDDSGESVEEIVYRSSGGGESAMNRSGGGGLYRIS